MDSAAAAFSPKRCSHQALRNFEGSNEANSRSMRALASSPRTNSLTLPTLSIA